MKQVDPKYKPIILLTASSVILMLFLLICRFCGIGYFANNYNVHIKSPFAINAINFTLKAIEVILVISILANRKWYVNVLIGSAWTCVYWIPMTDALIFVCDCVAIFVIPFILNKGRAETITYSLVLCVLLLVYQFIVLQARYTIDLDNKFNYAAGIASVLDYKLFILNLYFIRRIFTMSEDKTKLPEAEPKIDFGGGHCLLFFGPEKLKNKAAIVGHIIGFPIFVIIYGVAYTVKLLKNSCKKEE